MNTSNYQQLEAKVLNVWILTHPMTTVMENADGEVMKIAQTIPQIATPCIIKGATMMDQHRIHLIEV